MIQSYQLVESLVGLDIGGTLAKLCIATSQNWPTQIPSVEIKSQLLSPYHLHAMTFDSASQCFAFMHKHIIGVLSIGKVGVTGGGAYKYYQVLCQMLGEDKLVIINEFEGLSAGLKLLDDSTRKLKGTMLKTVEGKSQNQLQTILATTQLISISQVLPLLMVNIGSGVSMLLIESGQERRKFNFTRVGGTSLGGGFLMGLIKLETGESDYRQVMKKVSKDFENKEQSDSNASVFRNLHDLVLVNLCQISLTASQIHKVNNLLFTGSMVRHNIHLPNCFSKALDMLGQKIERRLVSLECEDGYLGVLGCIYLIMKQGAE